MTRKILSDSDSEDITITDLWAALGLLLIAVFVLTHFK